MTGQEMDIAKAELVAQKQPVGTIGEAGAETLEATAGT